MDEALIYVSARCVGPAGRLAEVRDIVAVSRQRNAALDVTGALVATPTVFAQILEGPGPHLAELMASIGRDARHRAIRQINLGGRSARDFPGWSLAYSGEATYVSRAISALLDSPGFDFPKQVNRLYFMIRKFAEAE